MNRLVLRLRLAINSYGFNHNIRQYELYPTDCQMCKMLKNHFNLKIKRMVVNDNEIIDQSIIPITTYCMPIREEVNIVKTDNTLFIDSPYIKINDKTTPEVFVNGIIIGNIDNNEFQGFLSRYFKLFITRCADLNNDKDNMS